MALIFREVSAAGQMSRRDEGNEDFMTVCIMKEESQ
jgi:hypothetical protein